jgi:ketosteroid isomerase-like protein
MKKFMVIAFIGFVSSSLAQTEQREINEQIWKSFIASFNSYQTEAFMALHSKDVVRSPRDSKKVYGWDEYFQNQKNGDGKSMQAGRKRNIELRFTERMASTTQAVDVGIYKTTNTDVNGNSRSGYGRFHVVMRKENGIWKILVDMDSTEGKTIGEKDFQAANPME